MNLLNSLVKLLHFYCCFHKQLYWAYCVPYDDMAHWAVTFHWWYCWGFTSVHVQWMTEVICVMVGFWLTELLMLVPPKQSWIFGLMSQCIIFNNKICLHSHLERLKSIKLWSNTIKENALSKQFSIESIFHYFCNYALCRMRFIWRNLFFVILVILFKNSCPWKLSQCSKLFTITITSLCT